MGIYQRVASRSDHATSTVEMNVNDDLNHKHIYLSPTLEGWRVILHWEEFPRDLDAHMFLPTGGEVNYSNKQSPDGLITLDVDCTQGHGVETITMLSHAHTGIFRYVVENYSKDGKLGESGALVHLYRNNDLLQIFRAPIDHNEGDYNWEVFAINTNTGTFDVINRMY